MDIYCFVLLTMIKTFTPYLCHKALEVGLMWLTNNPVCITTQCPASYRTHQCLKRHQSKSAQYSLQVQPFGTFVAHCWHVVKAECALYRNFNYDSLTRISYFEFHSSLAKNNKQTRPKKLMKL